MRDRLLGVPTKDVDLEVHGLPLERVEELLGHFGEVHAVGRAFGVLQAKGLRADVSLPRRDSKVGKGHRGFLAECDPDLGLEEALRRRDLTVNAMAWDPLEDVLHDPYDGERDLRARRLRAVDARHFAEDPLRGLRVMQFAARLEATLDPALVRLCASLDLTELPGERLLEEFRKLLLKAARPSIGLEALRQTTLLRFFPELQAMVGVPQDPEWHPEGDVWVHTGMVVDQAAALRRGDDSAAEDDEALMFGALCHDLGKPATTEWSDGHVRSIRHDTQGVAIARGFLRRLRAPARLVERVCALVEHHLKPWFFVRDAASDAAYRRLARRLGEAGTSMELLEKLARADSLGRTTPESRRGEFPAGAAFLERVRSLTIERGAPRDAVMGRHLVERGIAPGPEMGRILARCRAVQDETGWCDPAQILERVLGR